MAMFRTSQFYHYFIALERHVLQLVATRNACLKEANRIASYVRGQKMDPMRLWGNLRMVQRNEVTATKYDAAIARAQLNLQWMYDKIKENPAVAWASDSFWGTFTLKGYTVGRGRKNWWDTWTPPRDWWTV